MSGPGTDVAGEMQDYLMQKGVNTLFVELVEHILAEKPANPIQFIVSYLQTNYPDMTRTPAVTGFDPASDSDDDADEFEDDDVSKEDERDTLKTFTHKSRQRRISVSAPVMTDDPAKMAPISRGPIKTAEEKESLTESLRTCPLFGALTSAEIAMLVDAMKPEDAPDGSEIITQGEEGDRFYVLESGQCNIFQAKERGVDKVLVIKSGGYFGELAVMYNTPRAATVTAVGDCKLWWLDRVTVKTAIVKHTIRNRERFDGFLSSVPILSTLTETERLTVADALRVEEFEDGDVIIRQNDPGNTFYIVNDGSVVCTQQASPVSPPVELCKLGAGQYFGEIALLTDRPRQATVTASGSTVCLSLDRRTFRRVMGPLQDVLKRNISTYNTFMAQKI